MPCHGVTHLPCFAAGAAACKLCECGTRYDCLSAGTGKGAGFTLTALAAGRLLGGALWRITTPDGEDIIYAVRDGSVVVPIAIILSVCPIRLHALQCALQTLQAARKIFLLIPHPAFSAGALQPPQRAAPGGVCAGERVRAPGGADYRRVQRAGHGARPRRRGARARARRPGAGRPAQGRCGAALPAAV